MTSAIIFFVSSSSECPPCFDFGLNKQKRRVSGLSRSHAFLLRFVVSANSEFVNRHHSTKYSAESCTHSVHQTIFRHNGQARAESSVCRQVSFYEICAAGTNRMSASLRCPNSIFLSHFDWFFAPLPTFAPIGRDRLDGLLRSGPPRPAVKQPENTGHALRIPYFLAVIHSPPHAASARRRGTYPQATAAPASAAPAPPSPFRRSTPPHRRPAAPPSRKAPSRRWPVGRR